MLKSVKKANIYVYKKNNLIVAFCGLEDNYIKGLFVKTECRNEGIGTALMHHLMTRYEELTLKVFAENKKAIHFYEKLGFVTIDSNIDTLDNKELLMKWTKPTTE
ncbi:GNAT family N-acetyltransferase [Staphylococcus petrasii]|nr:GNAT family N-acetyltransferase [Staphylococcus petrasii]